MLINDMYVSSQTECETIHSFTNTNCHVIYKHNILNGMSSKKIQHNRSVLLEELKMPFMWKQIKQRWKTAEETQSLKHDYRNLR